MQLTKTKLRNLLGDENLEDLLFMCWNVGGLNQLDTELLVILIVGGKFRRRRRQAKISNAVRVEKNGGVRTN